MEDWFQIFYTVDVFGFGFSFKKVTKTITCQTSLEYSVDKTSQPTANLRPHFNSQFGPTSNFLSAPKLPCVLKHV